MTRTSVERAYDIRDCSRDYLEDWAARLREMIADGEDREGKLAVILAEVEAWIPHAADHFVTHRID